MRQPKTNRFFSIAVTILLRTLIEIPIFPYFLLSRDKGQEDEKKEYDSDKGKGKKCPQDYGCVSVFPLKKELKRPIHVWLVFSAIPPILLAPHAFVVVFLFCVEGGGSVGEPPIHATVYDWGPTAAGEPDSCQLIFEPASLRAATAIPFATTNSFGRITVTCLGSLGAAACPPSRLQEELSAFPVPA